MQIVVGLFGSKKDEFTGIWRILFIATNWMFQNFEIASVLRHDVV
jgi:hypothetical protein